MDATTTMTNSDFLAVVYGDLPVDDYGWVCNFRASPDQGDWGGRAYRGLEAQARIIDAATQDNTYFCTAVLSGFGNGSRWARQKATFKRLAALVVDDVDPASIVGGYTWAIQTSPGKWQCGICIDQDDTDAHDLSLVERVMSALSARGKLGGNDSSGNLIMRLVRLPFGMNTKPRPAGPWTVQLAEWHPQTKWSLEDACAAVGIELSALRGKKTTDARASLTGHVAHDAPSMQSAAADALALLSAPLDERSYHDALLRASASLVANGMFPGAVVEFLYAFMDRIRPHGPAEEVARWAARRAEISRVVRGAERYAPPERTQSITVNLGGANRANDGANLAPELLLTLEQLRTRASAVRWQVKGVIPEDSLGMMFGASGAFKSFVALDHALHVAHGLAWMGRKTTPGPVVYVAAEGGAGIYRRVDAWHRSHGVELCQNFSVCIVPLVLSISQQAENLAAAIEAMPKRPALVYIDTLSQTFEGDENSATDISAYLRIANSYIRARFNCTVVVIHHSGHSATERPRGSSAIGANVDFMLGVYRPDAGLPIARLEVIKQKDGDKLDAQSFELKRVILGADSDGDEISSLAAHHNDIADNVLNAYRARLSGHEQIVMGLMGESAAAAEHDLRHRFYNAFGAECRSTGREFKQDNARKAWNRALASLSQKGFLSVTGSGIVRNASDTGT